MASGRSRRIRIFALGVSVSVAVVGVFFTLAWLFNDSADYAWIPRLLGWLLVALNPYLPLFYRMLLRAFPAPLPAGRVAIQIASVAVFLGWWWLVAVAADRLLMRRRANHGAA